MSQPDDPESRAPEKERAQMPWWWTGAGDLPPLRTPDLLLSEEEEEYRSEVERIRPIPEGGVAELSDVDRRRLSRVVDLLRQGLPSHWALKDLPGPVHLRANEDAVWIEYHEGGKELRQQVTRPRWWVPSGRAALGRLLSELAIGLREKYEDLRAEEDRPSRGGE